MAVTRVGILSPGDMGASVGASLLAHGLRVLCCLDGRSERTRMLAQTAGLEERGTLTELVTECQVILSIMVPAAAEHAAALVASAIATTKSKVVFADCNAVAPATTMQINAIITEAGGRFVDGGIIGGPPSPSTTPRFYVSGRYAPTLAELDGKGIEVPVIGSEPGKASALKMCYASLTKGSSALHTAALVAAEQMDIYDNLLAELNHSQSTMLQRMDGVRSLSAKAFRWVGEMEEIAATFKAAGVSELLHKGAAETFALVADSELGHERPETIDSSRSLHDTVKAFARKSKPQ